VSRLKAPTADTIVRLYLLRQAEAFREQLAAGQPPETRDAIWTALSGQVDSLAAGGAQDIHRDQLPDNHPAAWPAGNPNDWLVLCPDDTLRLQP